MEIKLYREPGWAGNMQIYILEFNRDIVNSFSFILKKLNMYRKREIRLGSLHMKYISVKLIETSIQANSMMSLVKSYSDDKVMNGA